MAFWHELVTEKSFQLLTEFRKKYRFVLIGGWAVFLYTRQLKSKDIDLVLSHEELMRFREDWNVEKNSRLKKYEIKTGEFDVDLYVPFYSNPGLPPEAILKTQVSREGFSVPSIEELLLMKLNAYQARRDSLKGEKDRLDIASLVATGEIDWKRWRKLISSYARSDLQTLFRQFLTETREVRELSLSAHRWAGIKRGIL